jgi:hypothetical protein
MKVLKFQEGGMAPAPQAAPGGQPGGGPEEQIAAMAQQIVEQLGPEAAAMLAQAIMQMLQGGGEPQPQPAPQGEPVYAKQGGKLVLIGRR